MRNRVAAWALALICLLAAGAARAEDVWVREDWQQLTGEYDCAGVRLSVDARAMILRLTDASGTCVSENCELFASPKFFQFQTPGITCQMEQVGEDCRLSLTCAAFAWGVWLDTTEMDCTFSDNGFFLLPGETRVIVASGVLLEHLEKQLTITQVYDPADEL